MNINEELRRELTAHGVAQTGFADLRGLPSEIRKGYDFGISLAATMTPAVLMEIGNGPTMAYAAEYARLNETLDAAGEVAVKILARHGYQAWNRRRRELKPDRTTLLTELPHKTIATRAGMGWIGKCALLITEKFGAAVRISSVLTNAPLETAVPVDSSRCGKCNVCQQICPGQAVKGVNWQVSMDREEYYDAFKCCDTAVAVSAKVGLEHSLCGLCILKCPWTQKFLRQADKA